ncbi:MAG: nucleotidyltransferase domain-containing protein [Nanoarchaeota archaeon]
MKKGYNTSDFFEDILILKCLGFFFKNPYEKIHLREFSRKMKISLNTSQRFLNLFLEQGFIQESREANLRYFKANLNSLTFKYLKIAFSLKELESSGLIDYLTNKFIQIVLFGSIAKGEDDINSDVDLVCIGLKKELDLFEFSKKLKKEINVHFFNPAQWKKQKQENKAFYQDVISTGINLIGEMPIVE